MNPKAIGIFAYAFVVLAIYPSDGPVSFLMAWIICRRYL